MLWVYQKTMKRYLLFIALFLSGASALIYEVVSSKALFFFFASTTYTVSTVLVSFLFGLALGSLLMATFIDKINNKRNFFAMMQIVIGAYALLFLIRFDSIPFYLISLYHILGESFLGTLSSKFLISLVYLLIPTVMLGACFPLVTSMMVKKKEESAKDVGLLYSYDTFGAILGALFAGFFLLPFLGLKMTVFVGAGINFLAAFLIVRKKPKELSKLFIIILVIISSSFFLNQTAQGEYALTGDVTADVVIPEFIPQTGILFEKETAYGQIKVYGETNKRILFIDRRDQCRYDTDSFNYSEMQISRVALQNFKDETDVLNIGLGCGFTLAAILESDFVNNVDVVEINPVMKIVAGAYFKEFNGDALNDPRTNLIFDDGAHYLLENKKKYDAIIIDVENPAIIHSSPLYTKEYFGYAKKNLKKDGVFAVWAFFGDFDYYNIIYSTLKTKFKYVYYKDYDNDFFLASDYPLDIQMTEQEKHIHELFEQNPNSEINTMDKPVLQKYFKDWNE